MKEFSGFCCSDMETNVSKSNLVYYNQVFDEYGLNVIEDNASYILTEYCPWCGERLPLSKRDLWFDELEKLGFENPLFESNIPEKYKSDAWYKDEQTGNGSVSEQ